MGEVDGRGNERVEALFVQRSAPRVHTCTPSKDTYLVNGAQATWL